MLKFSFNICDKKYSGLQFFNCSLNSIIIKNLTSSLLNNICFSSESNNLKEGFLGLKKSLG